MIAVVGDRSLALHLLPHPNTLLMGSRPHLGCSPLGGKPIRAAFMAQASTGATSHRCGRCERMQSVDEVRTPGSRPGRATGEPIAEADHPHELPPPNDA
jgi:hypothetical protein